MSGLKEFLRNNPVEGLTDVVPMLLKRGENVLNADFTIRIMTSEDFERYRKEANKIKRHGKIEFDNRRFNELVAINHTIEPNFKSAEDVREADCTSPEEYLYRSLKPGEIEYLVGEINVLSGFDADMQELRDEAKNS